MKKFLMLAIILLNLLPVISDSDYYQASAQRHSSEYDVCYREAENLYYVTAFGCGLDEDCYSCPCCDSWVAESYYIDHLVQLHDVPEEDALMFLYGSGGGSGSGASSDNSSDAGSDDGDTDDDGSCGGGGNESSGEVDKEVDLDNLIVNGIMICQFPDLTSFFDNCEDEFFYSNGSFWGLMSRGLPNISGVKSRGDKYWDKPELRMSLSNLKILEKSGYVRTLGNLPDKFKKQTTNYECTACGIATSAWLKSGNETDYMYAYADAYTAADESGIDLTENGIAPEEYLKVYGKYFYIEEYAPQGYSDYDVQGYINRGISVNATYWTGECDAYGTLIAHEVTIVAYDLNFYYTAYGREDVLAIPKTAIHDYPIHIYKGSKLNF